MSSKQYKLKNLKLGYHYLISNSIYFILIILLNLIIKQDLTHLCTILLTLNPLPILSCSSLLIILATLYFVTNRPRKIYLVDFACYKPSQTLKTSKTTCIERIALSNAFSQKNIDFQKKICEKSGIGEESYLPDSITSIPPRPRLIEAQMEGEMLMFGVIDELLAKTGVSPDDIRILVVNNSVYNPSPSLAAMIVNHYRLREDIINYNITGMGCSAGVISIDLAQHLLQVHRNSYALVITTEVTSLNWYFGNDRSMLIPNCLFKMGAAAILLSNKHSDRHQSKYRLAHVVRTHRGAHDRSYTCIYEQEDDTQCRGVSLSKDLMLVAGEALKTNITTLGPLVLPMSEQLLFLATLVAKKLFRVKKIRPYIPDFKLAFEHFCIHAGGKAVLDALEKNLQLTPWHMEPSKMTLYRFGNTSSSSLWYELAYMEAKGRINKGHRICQIGFGSGFKCNSVVWHALRNISPGTEKNPWMEEINNFPIQVPEISPIVISNMGVRQI